MCPPSIPACHCAKCRESHPSNVFDFCIVLANVVKTIELHLWLLCLQKRRALRVRQFPTEDASFLRRETRLRETGSETLLQDWTHLYSYGKMGSVGCPIRLNVPDSRINCLFSLNCHRFQSDFSHLSRLREGKRSHLS